MIAISVSAAAEPVRFDAVISVKSETKLELADGSKRYLLATQREGVAAGTGPLAGATMLEFGMHDVNPGTGAAGSGLLVLTQQGGDLSYLRYQFRATPATAPDGKALNLINGSWEVIGGTGHLKDLKGAGTVHIAPVSPTVRHWFLDGELLQAGGPPTK